MNGTLVQQIGKKFGILQREVDISKSKLLEITQKADLCDENITETENLINKIRDKQLEMHAKAELMEKNLIKVLNNPIGVQIDKDIDKITKENNKYIESLKAALETKNTNVTEIQAFLEKVVIDLNQVKSSHREKINEIVKCVHDIKNEGVTTKEEINKILDSIKNNEDKLRLDIDNLNSEMTEIKGPIIDIIKTQHHENESLTNEIGRQLETNRNLVGKIALNIDSLSALTPLNSNLHSPSRESTHQVLEFFKPTSRMQSTSPIRVQSASPSMSAKNRSYRGNSAFKISASPVKLDDN